MKEGFDVLGLGGCRVNSTVFDGIYFQIRIQKFLNDAMCGLHNEGILCNYDTLHKSGLVDTHSYKKKKNLNEWILSNTDVCQKLFRMFN